MRLPIYEMLRVNINQVHSISKQVIIHGFVPCSKRRFGIPYQLIFCIVETFNRYWGKSCYLAIWDATICWSSLEMIALTCARDSIELRNGYWQKKGIHNRVTISVKWGLFQFVWLPWGVNRMLFQYCSNNIPLFHMISKCMQIGGLLC